MQTWWIVRAEADQSDWSAYMYERINKWTVYCLWCTYIKRSAPPCHRHNHQQVHEANTENREVCSCAMKRVQFETTTSRSTLYTETGSTRKQEITVYTILCGQVIYSLRYMAFDWAEEERSSSWYTYNGSSGDPLMKIVNIRI